MCRNIHVYVKWYKHQLFRCYPDHFAIQSLRRTNSLAATLRHFTIQRLGCSEGGTSAETLWNVHKLERQHTCMHMAWWLYNLKHSFSPDSGYHQTDNFSVLLHLTSERTREGASGRYITPSRWEMRNRERGPRIDRWIVQLFRDVRNFRPAFHHFRSASTSAAADLNHLYSTLVLESV